MPVVVTALTSKLKLQFQTGVDGEGNPVYKNKTISRIKSAASDQDILDVALGMASLCENSLNAITRTDDSDLANQE